MKFAVAFAAIMWSLVALKAIDEKADSADAVRHVVVAQAAEPSQAVAEDEPKAASLAFDMKHGYRREWFPR